MRRLSWLSVLFFSGCIEYYGQLCTDHKLQDIPKLEGKKSLTAYDPATAEVVSTGFEVMRTAKGEYRIDQAEFRTCKIEGRYLAEVKLPSGNFVAKEILIGNDGQYTESTLVIGKSELDKLGIPYEIETRETTQMIPEAIKRIPFVKRRLNALAEEEAPAQVLVVMNKTRKHNKSMVKNFKPIYLGYSYR